MHIYGTGKGVAPPSFGKQPWRPFGSSPGRPEAPQARPRDPSSGQRAPKILEYPRAVKERRKSGQKCPRAPQEHSKSGPSG